MLYDIGEMPGIGVYEAICYRCNHRWRVTLDNETDRLPPCGICGPGQVLKYRRVTLPYGF